MARKPVTVSLPADLVRETTRFCEKWSVTLSEIVREAVRDYLYNKQLDQARRRVTSHLRKRGILSEQDLLRFLQD
jgi:metal-responsive CopG/Arc/MetJ family transcriptional regulator